MGVYKRGDVWWYKFTWKGELIRESTKQSNKRIAEQIEAVRKAALVKGEVGIKEKKPCPTLSDFLQRSFQPFLEATKAEEPNTVAFYRACITNLLAWPKLAEANLEQIKSALITNYISQRQKAGLSVATINRELATLKRALRLASERGDLQTSLPKIVLLDGEAGRERVLRADEEAAYLAAAAPQLRTVATIMLDCGLRPDEVYRLRWDENYRDERIVIHTGKTRAARRGIPATPRVIALLEMLRPQGGATWIFGAPTKSGHVEQSSLKKQHLKALKSSKVLPFVPYDLRHTCLTRWAKWLDPFTLKKLAGHECLSTTMKYIHLNESDSDARLGEARRKIESEHGEGGHKCGHSHSPATSTHSETVLKHKQKNDLWRARRGSNSRPIDSKSIALSN